MVRTILQLTEDQAKGLQRKSKEQGKSVSELVRQGVEMVLRSQITDAEVRRRAREAVGFADSGTGDLVDRHNEIFARGGEE
jgi:hypothetical protein